MTPEGQIEPGARIEPRQAATLGSATTFPGFATRLADVVLWRDGSVDLRVHSGRSPARAEDKSIHFASAEDAAAHGWELSLPVSTQELQELIAQQNQPTEHDR